MKAIRFDQIMDTTGRIAARLFARLRVGLGVFIYLMVGMSPAMADDIDVYTKNIASGGGGAPVIILQIDNSGSMKDEDTSDNSATSYLRRRQYLVQDAARGQVTGLNGRFKVGLFEYKSSDSGVKIADAKALNTEVSTTAMSGGTVTYPITSGDDDVSQVNGEGMRFADGTLAMSTYDRSPTTVPVTIPVSSNWTLSGGQIWDSTATTAGNKVYWYKHGSTSTTSQTITLTSTGAPTIDTYLYFQDASGNNLAINDDTVADYYSCTNASYTELQETIPAGEPTTPAAPRCARTCSKKDISGPPASAKFAACASKAIGEKVYVAAFYNSGNLNSTLNVTGLVNGTWYRIVVATYTPAKTGTFTLNFSNPTKGTLERESAGPTEVDQRVGLMFHGIEIPKGASISKAYLEFQSASANSDSTVLTVGLDPSATPQDFLTFPLFGRSPDYQAPVAVSNWTNNQMDAGTRIDVTGLVNTQVNRSDWCGGDMAFLIKGPNDLIAKRIAHSFESNTGAAPKLVVTWAGDADTNCYKRTLTLDVKNISEDVSESATGAMSFTNPSLPVSITQKAGLRFSLVPLPSGVKVTSATLELMSYATTTARPITIAAVDQAIAKPFGGSNNALSLLPLLDNRVTWTPPGWIVGSRYTSPDISGLIQPLLDNPGWEYDGTIGLVLQGGNASPMSIRAWERHQSGDTSFSLNKSEYGQFSARLRITVTSEKPIPIVTTHRHQLADFIDAIPASTNTPIAGAFLESSQYMLGKDGYTLPELAEGDCATNAIVFLTDGDETGDYSAYPGSFPTAAKAITGKTCSVSSTAGIYTCIYQMQDALYQGTTLASNGKKYSIRSYAVGFGPVSVATTGNLPETGNHGGGRYYGATNAGALANVFQEIMASMVDGGASVAAPGVAVNSLNKFEHLDELYYSLFKPSTRVNWRGNAKRYRLGSGLIEDVNRVAAIDPLTARFGATAQSWWSDLVDGSVVTMGGAAGELKTPDSRPLYTYMGANTTSLNVSLYPSVGADRDGAGAEIVDKANTFLTINTMGVDKLSDYGTMSGVQLNAARDSAITWLRGGTNLLPALSFGAAIHASPTLVNYGRDVNGAINTLFVGDNDGVLRMIDSGAPNSNPAAPATDKANTGGRDLFSFIPKELLGNSAMLNANTRSVLTDGYIYGLDGFWSAWKNDLNGDDIISGSDKVYIYGGMRRGGKNYYGLDVTSVRRDLPIASRAPSLIWVIQGGSAGAYANMGQSWSEPIVRSVLWGGAKKTVVFFSGGYDAPVHDGSQAFSSSPQLGRQVYMVDALTGTLLWWASSEAGSSTSVPDMKYSIPAAPVAIDRNGNGYVDGLYVADLAGQVFRFDIREDASNASSFVRDNAARVIAKLGATASGASLSTDNRRFFDQPAVAYMDSAAGGDVLLAITSGYREVPASSTTNEKAFMVIDRGAWNIAPAAPTTITVADLATLPATGELTSAADLAKPGWQMDFEKPLGEKGMGTPLFFNFVLLFSAYVPKGVASDLQCAPDIGYSRLYVINSLTGRGVVNLEFNNVSANQRFVDQTVPGLSSAPQMLFRAGRLTTLTGTFAADAPTLSKELTPVGISDLTRSMWYEIGQ